MNKKLKTVLNKIIHPLSQATHELEEYEKAKDEKKNPKNLSFLGKSLKAFFGFCAVLGIIFCCTPFDPISLFLNFIFPNTNNNSGPIPEYMYGLFFALLFALIIVFILIVSKENYSKKNTIIEEDKKEILTLKEVKQVKSKYLSNKL